MDKLKRGNLVKILVGHLIYSKCGVEDIEPKDVGRLAVVNDESGGKYSITYCDTGVSMSWKSRDELEYIAEGGDFLLEQALEKRELRPD